MSKDEFIQKWCDVSGIGAEFRTDDGYRRRDGYTRTALPCDCGEEGCEGWQMVNTD